MKIQSYFKAAVATFLFISHALAATITHTTAVFPSPTNWSLTNTVPQFDPSLGTLTNVSVTVGANMRNRLRVESRSNLPRTATARGVGAITATVGGLSAQAGITNSHTQALGAFDGVIDYGGASGFDVTVDGAGYAAEIATDLVPFIGIGNIPLSASSAANGTFNGPGDYQFIVSTTASAIVTVTYEFSPPVCPECHPACNPEPECDEDDRRDGRRSSRKRRW